MKLRVRNNSIRLRLTQSEVADFAAHGEIEEKIEFGINTEKQLIYRLERKEIETTVADFNDGKITISIPASDAEIWTQTNDVGIKAEQAIGADRTLKILIEKDFACAETRDGENDSDAFPNPNAGNAC